MLEPSGRSWGNSTTTSARGCGRLPVTPALADKTAAVCARLPRTAFLRAADAVHLISAREHGLPEIYTNDRHMSAAAHHFRLKVRTVEAR